MAILAAAVILLSVICTFNLLLSLGLARKIREQGEKLERILAGTEDIIPVGEKIGPFTTQATNGELLSHEMFTNDTLVAFFAADCSSCKQHLPNFVEFAKVFAGGRERILVVVSGEQRKANEVINSVRDVAITVYEEINGPLGRAFRVKSFPGYCIVDDSGTVKTTGFDFGEPMVPVGA